MGPRNGMVILEKMQLYEWVARYFDGGWGGGGGLKQRQKDQGPNGGEAKT